MSRLYLPFKPICHISSSFSSPICLSECNLRLMKNGRTLFIVQRQFFGVHYFGSLNRNLLHNTHHNVKHLPTSRPFSLKIKSPPVIIELEKEKKTFQDVINEPAVIEIDEEKFRRLSKDFVNSLSKNQLKNSENVWKDIPSLTVSSTLDHYAKLAKLKLTGLVVLTTLAGFYMGISGSMNYPLLASTLIGTTLTSGSAAAWNHFLEVPFDSQMKRTQDRPLVQGLITPLHAATFAFVTGLSGITILATCVNPLTAVLGGLNLCLYSFIYTPMKRVHIANTWVGAIVGAIPPVMGFTAINNAIDLPSILLGLVLYSWQFPHFNALSWNMRHEYARAGYRMMSVTDPKLCQNTALRHSLILLGCTTAMCATGMTHWSFGVDTLPFSLYLIYLSYQFRSDPSSQTSRKLFLYSLIYLPVVMFLMVISKNRKINAKQSPSTVDSTVAV